MRPRWRERFWDAAADLFMWIATWSFAFAAGWHLARWFWRTR